MKKFIVVVLSVLAFAAVASAQPRALGIRAGYGGEISYQHGGGAGFLEADLGFWAYVGRIAWKIFPILFLPGLLAWTIRYTTRRLQRVLMRWSRYTFYIWFFGLTLAMVLSTRALLVSHLSGGTIALIVLVSMATCALQFLAGRRIGRRAAGAGEANGASGGQTAITAGQALGQKNTGFLIWLGYNYLTPVTSVAGGLYAIWQNLFNSWELLQHSGRASSEKH